MWGQVVWAEVPGREGPQTREEPPMPNSPCHMSPLAGHSGNLAALNRVPWLATVSLRT